MSIIMVGYRCPICQDTGFVWRGSGEPDDPMEERPCPVCVTGTEEPEWEEWDDDGRY